MLVVVFSPLGLLVEIVYFFLEIGFLHFSSLHGIYVTLKIVTIGD